MLFRSTYTSDHDIYFTLTDERFEEIFIPLYESMGYAISDYSVEQESKDGNKIVVISFANTIAESTMYQTQYFFVTASDLVCTLTVTATSPESSIAADIYESLIIAE